ncbi:MAG TPA: PrsW family glutamic-type intramembrane protease [Bacteroidales bacterium]|jgi:RsiW-degrading membrane proteinase PrsW (M82 family)|nr:PrsW family glutamic-type intramembrane protease [Bacteroidales bacterium]HPD23321.1 PrsW family glutamic-type intramembrane protease [Bacteroidales bacterium]HRS99743.1 PrsW family glutamic-type intramembrane protease [Bacteroidales bacterium]HRT79539.1 PrsW family glutamic-type intramembrane protease [Bacteroidales bacterium]
MIYLSLAIAPVVIILFSIYISDSYNREPIGLLLLTLFAGMLAVIPVLIAGVVLSVFEGFFYSKVDLAFFQSFIQAGFIEELFKFLAVLLLIWRNKNFDEKYDGIVYAVFVSMGFALVENILYVFGYGMGTGIIRAFTAVPAHAIFGISMGYYLGLAKFKPSRRSTYLALAFIVPWMLHGFYDFILFLEIDWLLIIFVIYLIFLYIFGLNRIIKLYKTKKQIIYKSN